MPLTLLDNTIFDLVEVVPNVTAAGIVYVNYELKSIPSNSMRISLINFLGVELFELFNGVPSSLSGNLPLDVSNYASGFYYIVFLVEDIFYISPPSILQLIKH